MSEERFLCSISRTPILEGQKVRVIIGENLTSRNGCYSIEDEERKPQTTIGMSIPAITTRTGLDLDKSKMSKNTFKRFIQVFMEDEFVCETLEDFLNIYISIDPVWKNNSYSVILDEVYALLTKSMPENKKKKSFNLKDSKNLISLLLGTEDHKSNMEKINKKIEKERNDYYKDYTEFDLQLEKERGIDEFQYNLEKNQLLNPTKYLDTDILDILSNVIALDGLVNIEEALLLKQNGKEDLTTFILEDLSFRHNLKEQNLIITSATKTNIDFSKNQLSFQEELLEINKKQLTKAKETTKNKRENIF